MGLLDLFKKKEIAQPSTNVDTFNSKGLIGYIKSNLENPSDENVLKVLDNLAKPADDLDHLDEKGELPWGWHTQNKAFTEKINTEYTYFLNMWLDSQKQEPKRQYEALKSFVLYMEDVEKLCKSKGECFEFWFNKILTSTGYLEKRKEELEYLTANFNEIEKNYKKKQFELADLDARIVKMLKDNPGIIQADFVKLFDPIIQNEVKEKLYYMDKSGCLERIKSGRSYVLNYRG